MGGGRALFIGTLWWLRSVASGSASNVCYVNNNGNANYNSATNVWVRPRPGFPYCQTE